MTTRTLPKKGVHLWNDLCHLELWQRWYYMCSFLVYQSLIPLAAGLHSDFRSCPVALRRMEQSQVLGLKRGPSGCEWEDAGESHKQDGKFLLSWPTITIAAQRNSTLKQFENSDVLSLESVMVRLLFHHVAIRMTSWATHCFWRWYRKDHFRKYKKIRVPR